MPETITLRPIGTVTGGRDEWVEDDWYGVKSVIRLDPDQFDPGVVLGLTDFSHLEVVFYFDRIDPSAVRTEPRPPRGNPAWPAVGVFAGHGPSARTSSESHAAGCWRSRAWTSTSRISTRSTAPLYWTSSPTWSSSRPETRSPSRPGRSN